MLNHRPTPRSLNAQMNSQFQKFTSIPTYQFWTAKVHIHGRYLQRLSLAVLFKCRGMRHHTGILQWLMTQNGLKEATVALPESIWRKQTLYFSQFKPNSETSCSAVFVLVEIYSPSRPAGSEQVTASYNTKRDGLLSKALWDNSDKESGKTIGWGGGWTEGWTRTMWSKSTLSSTQSSRSSGQ